MWHQSRSTPWLQGDARAQFGDDVHVLPLLLYADGDEVRGKSTLHFHPLLVYLAGVPLHHLKHADAYVRWAMLPSLDAIALDFRSTNDPE